MTVFFPPDDWPLYSCLILEASDARLILEQRPATAKRAAGSITCFGGTREPGETPEECLLRELEEELGWQPSGYVRTTELWRGGKPLAWFYFAKFPLMVIPNHREPGHATVLLTRTEALHAPVSPWHRAALRGHYEGTRAIPVDDVHF